MKRRYVNRIAARLGARVIGALARYLAEPVSRPAATVTRLRCRHCCGPVTCLTGRQHPRSGAGAPFDPIAVGACLDLRRPA